MLKDFRNRNYIKKTFDTFLQQIHHIKYQKRLNLSVGEGSHRQCWRDFSKGREKIIEDLDVILKLIGNAINTEQRYNNIY